MNNRNHEKLMESSHDKFLILQALHNAIYQKSYAQLKEWVNRVVVLHCLRYPGSSEAFLFKGEVYWKTPQATLRKGTRALLLHQSQYEDMDRYLAERAELTQETPLVNTFLSCAMSEATSINDLPYFLPECLHPHLHGHQWNGYVPAIRTAEEGMAFQTKNAGAVTTIKMRLVRNLIT